MSQNGYGSQNPINLPMRRCESATPLKDVCLAVFHRHTAFMAKVRKLGGIAGRARLEENRGTECDLRHHIDLSFRKKACVSISQKVYLEPKWLR